MPHSRINLLTRGTPQPDQNPNPRELYKWLALIILILLVLGVGCAVGRAILPGNQDQPTNNLTLEPKNVGFLEAVKNFIFKPNAVLDSSKDDTVNILLLGMGGIGHDGPFLTDTNIIVRLRPETAEVAMISVPRDLGVNIPGKGWYKINFANHFGELDNSGQGGELAREVFEETFGMDIPYYARVDFTAFEELVDIVGGVKVDVPRSFTDYEYPAPQSATQTIKFEQGTEIMTGQRALMFARSRHGTNGEGSDFARSFRQQLVLMALKKELLSLGTYTSPRKIQKILNSLSTHVATNLDIKQIMYLAGVAKDIEGPITTLVLDNSINGFLTESISPSGAYILSPKDNDFGPIKHTVEKIFDQPPTPPPASKEAVEIVVDLPVESPIKIEEDTTEPLFPSVRIEIQNGTWRVGLAARTKKELTAKGFAVSLIGNSLKRPITTSSIYLINSSTDKKTLEALKNEITAPLMTVLPEWLTPNYDDQNTLQDESGNKFEEETDVLIILGEDTQE